MNEYRITFDTKDAVGQATVTAIDEKDARRTFKEAAETCAVITAIDLIRENVLATKAQERAALEKIKGIVKTLGPQSYLATAFDGCFQDAEDNIDDDAAYSMKARYEDAHDKLRREIAEHQATKKELEKVRAALRDTESNVDYLAQAASAAEKRVISADLWNKIYHIVKAHFDIAVANMAEAAETMAACAKTPHDIAFSAAVKSYNANKKTKLEARAVMDRLEEIAPDGAEL